MPFSMTVAPKALPVTIDEIRTHCVISTPDTEDETFLALIAKEDAQLELFIKSAAIHGQILTGQQFVEASFDLDLESFPGRRIKLLPKLQSIASVKYVDGNGVDIILDPALYKIKKTALVGYIEPVASWPTIATDIIVEFKAGWPVTETPDTDPVEYVSTTPEDIKTWIMVRVAGLYEQRENFVLSKGGKMGVVSMPANFIDHILDCRVVPGLGAGI